jgi:ACT domain
MKGIRKVAYYYTLLPDRIGEGAKVLAGFAGHRVNFLALSGFPNGRRVQLDFFPGDPKAFKAAARKLKVRLIGPKIGFLLQGNDHIGAIAQVLAALAKAGVNVVSINAVSAVKGRFGMIFWVAPDSVAKAAKVLRAK